MAVRRSTGRVFSFIPSLFLLLTSACGSARAGQAAVWIDVPVDGLVAPAGQPIQIEGHASSPLGIGSVVVYVNGAQAATLESLEGEGALVRFAYSWTPPGVGEYAIQAVAVDADGGSSTPDVARVMVGAAVMASPTPTIPPPAGPTPVVTVTPTLPPGASVEFYADPPTFPAGGCAMLVWRVSNARSARLGVTEVALEGMYEICHCTSTSYTLTVVGLDGTEEEHRLPIEVTGTCASPTPPDGTAPPAPVLATPANGASLGCVANVNLTWNSVSDPSGISQYQVEVQRHSGDNNWQTVSGSPWTGLTSTSRSIAVECGWTYRWRVRAVDGAGNVGAWSGWFSFVVSLI